MTHVWEGRDCWFTVLKGMRGETFILTEDDPHRITRAEGRRSYSDEDIIFTVQLNDQESSIGFMDLILSYRRGVRPGFELRQHLEYGGTL